LSSKQLEYESSPPRSESTQECEPPASADEDDNVIRRFAHQFILETLKLTWSHTTRGVVLSVLEVLREAGRLQFDLSSTSLKPEGVTVVDDATGLSWPYCGDYFVHSSVFSLFLA
jgi:hypothetical protein